MNDPLLKHCANLKSFADHIKRRKTFEMDLPCFLLSWLRNLQLIPLTQSQAEDDDDWEEGDDIFLYSPKNFLTISKPSHKSGTQKPSIGAKKEDEVLEVSAALLLHTVD